MHRYSVMASLIVYVDQYAWLKLVRSMLNTRCPSHLNCHTAVNLAVIIPVVIITENIYQTWSSVVRVIEEDGRLPWLHGCAGDLMAIEINFIRLPAFPV